MGGDEVRVEGAGGTTADRVAEVMVTEQAEVAVGKPQEVPVTGAEPPAENEAAAVERMMEERPASDSVDERLRGGGAEGDSGRGGGSTDAASQGPAEPGDVGESRNEARAPSEIGSESVHLEANAGTGTAMRREGRDGQDLLGGALEMAAARAEKFPAGDEARARSAELSHLGAGQASAKSVMATAGLSVSEAVHDQRITAGLPGSSPAVANGHAAVDVQGAKARVQQMRGCPLTSGVGNEVWCPA